MNAASRIYFAVPTHYTTGDAFDTFAEAEAAARATIAPFDGIPGSSRAFVDVREVDEAGSDRPIHRVEVFGAATPTKEDTMTFRPDHHEMTRGLLAVLQAAAEEHDRDADEVIAPATIEYVGPVNVDDDGDFEAVEVRRADGDRFYVYVEGVDLAEQQRRLNLIDDAWYEIAKGELVMDDEPDPSVIDYRRMLSMYDAALDFGATVDAEGATTDEKEIAMRVARAVSILNYGGDWGGAAE